MNFLPAGHLSSTHTTPKGKDVPQSSRLLAIGDIHGCIRPLEALLETLRPQAADWVVVLGDVVDRGPASCQVIERLIKLQSETRMIMILGNHEEEMLASREDRLALERFLAMGGAAALSSYGSSAELKDIPDAHWQFLEQALPWWECDDYFFTHANYDADLPLCQQKSAELRWMGLADQPVRPHCSGKTAIVGHTPNLLGHVVDYGFLRCLDTGCGIGGYLTVMDVRSRQIWQCAEASDVVIWGART